MTTFTSLTQIDDEAELEEVSEDFGAQEPEHLASVQSSMQEENDRFQKCLNFLFFLNLLNGLRKGEVSRYWSNALNHF
jgi:hypothetical protein